MKIVLLFGLLYFLILNSFSQKLENFKSQYHLVIAGSSFKLKYSVKANAHREWADSAKLILRTDSCMNYIFCLIDSIQLSDLDSIMTSEIKVYKNDNKLSVYKIILEIIEPDGKQIPLISRKNYIARHKRIKYLSQLPSNSKVMLKSVWFRENKKDRVIASYVGWKIL